MIRDLRKIFLQSGTSVYKYLNFFGFPRKGLRTLMYHSVGTPVEGDPNQIYNISLSQFEGHMRFLASHYKNNIVSLDAAALESNDLKVALTFDDGYRNNLLVAAPIMAELNIPFTIFICTGSVMKGEVGFLTKPDIKALAAFPGATIGSHTVSHRKLVDCHENETKEELVSSKCFLEDLLGCEIDRLSYPHGSVNQRVRKIAKDAGYRIGGTSRFDINKSDRDPLLLCRTDIWAQDDTRIFKEKIEGLWDWNRWRSKDPSIFHE